MGGQACILYSAAECSRDTDLTILAEAENLERLALALANLQVVEFALLVARTSHARIAHQSCSGASRRVRGSTLAAPLLSHAITADFELLSRALLDEELRERALDRTYWLALKAELEQFGHQR